jgi:hypothetical protein
MSIMPNKLPSEPNPEWVNAPYVAYVLDEHGKVKKVTEPPVPADGEYHNSEGKHTMTIKDGKVIKCH